MKTKTTLVSLSMAILVGAALYAAEDKPKAPDLGSLPAPAKEHEWLKQFAGEWESEMEMYMEPGKEPMKAKGVESGRMLGGFWAVVEGKAEMMGMPFTSVLTLGYDPEKKKYFGTWVDSMNSYMWRYEGTVDSAGKVLALNTEGPCPMQAGKISKFKEVTEFKSKDERVFTSSIQGDDGKWQKMITVTSRKKK